MKALTKAHNLDGKKCISILRFLSQFRIACDLNVVSKVTDLEIIPTFTKDGPVSSVLV